MISAMPAHVDVAHTGPGTLAGRYLRNFWQPVLLASSLLPGRAKPIHIMGTARERLLERQAPRPPAAGEPANVVANRILRGELDWADLERRPDLVNVQDNAAQVGQGPIADRTNEGLGRSDVGIILLRQIWARELQAFAAGISGRQWERTPRVQAWSGGRPAATTVEVGGGSSRGRNPPAYNQSAPTGS